MAQEMYLKAEWFISSHINYAILIWQQWIVHKEHLTGKVTTWLKDERYINTQDSDLYCHCDGKIKLKIFTLS